MREEIQINQVDFNEFKCPICIQVFYKPIKTSCGHNFCGKCISKWMQKRKQCPFCRRDFPNYNFYEKDKQMELKVEMLEVTCLRCNNWSGHLIELKNHRQNYCLKSSEIMLQPNNFLIIQDDLEDPQQIIMNEILQITKQQNYIKLLEFENSLISQYNIKNNEPNLRKKRKINDLQQIDQEVQELSNDEIKYLKNSENYQISQINKRFQLQNKFLKDIMVSQYQDETKKFFAQLLNSQNIFLFTSMIQKYL
ncbi:unnamed protein product [Paramecium sonneborni]|uniref:RING-type domain-containing protein n=1 Tax=Paramecium sonneborni TaxID=65129 RepID=A0A8S1MG34_9CILI|nr:unnamed protein product [Paramecium sonneborni]